MKNNNYKYTTTVAKNVEKSDLEILSPLINGVLIAIVIVIAAVTTISHYLALFRIRKEIIKMRELLENSPLNRNYNKKNNSDDVI